MTSSERMRLQELEAAAALEALEPAEREELALLRQRYPDAGDDAAEFERALAAITTAALASHLQPLPAQLEQRLLSAADQVLPPAATPAPASPPRARAPARAAPSAGVLPWLGWALAAALAVLYFSGLAPRTGTQPTRVAQGLAPAEARARMLQAHRYSFLEPFGKGPDATGAAVSGDVVWDDATQQGYLRLTGLKPNDPRLEEYQLWIFDKDRDERYPVDGGVFDTARGEAIIPIHAKIQVYHAVMFAITVERPGGVVVSSRERIAALARAT